MATINSHTTRASGTVLTPTIYNGDHENHVTNATNLNNDKVEKPASATDNAIVRLDGASGAIQETGIIADDSDNLSGIGNIDLSGTVDGRDVAADGTKLDGIESGATADQTNEEIQDAAWDVLGGTQTLITVTYSDAGNNVSFVVDNDLANYDNTNTSFLASGDIGSTVQAWDADLDAIAALSSADGNFIVGSASGWVVESGATARASLGLGAGDSPTFASLTLSGANGVDVNPGSDVDADLITVGVTGSPTLSWDESQDRFSLTHGLNINVGGADVTATINTGGTGFTARFEATETGGNNSAFFQYEAADNNLEIGTIGSSTDFVAIRIARGSTAVQIPGTIELGHASDTTLQRDSAGVVAVEGSVLAFREPNRNAQTGTSYTLALSDTGGIVTMDNSSANTLTIPTNSSVAFPINTIINVVQLGSGTTTISADTGVTINGASAGSGDVGDQYGAVSLLKVGTDTWVASGSIGAV